MQVAHLLAAVLWLATLLVKVDSRPAGVTSRQLQQDDEQVIVAVVNTFQELQTAIESGAAHIQVQSHLDATSFPLIEAEINGALFKHLLPPQRGQTHSIVGNCTDDMPASFQASITGEPMLPRKAGQCVILAQKPVFAMSESNVLLANFYVRYATASAGGFGFEDPSSSTASLSWLVHAHGGNVWSRDMTIQGDGNSQIGAIIVFPTAHVMFFQSTIAHTSTTTGNGVPVTIRSSPTTFVICEFFGHETAAGAPVIYADAGAPVWVQESEFENNTADPVFASRGGAQFFSDDAELAIDTGEAQPEEVQPLSAADADIKLLAWSETWITEVEPLLESDAVRLLPVEEALVTDGGIGTFIEPELQSSLSPGLNPVTGAPPGADVLYGPDGSNLVATDDPEATVTPDDGDDGVSVGLVVGIVVPVVVVCAIVTLIAVLLSRKRKAAAAPPPPPGMPPPHGDPYAPGPYGHGSFHPAYGSNYFTPGQMPADSYHDSGASAATYGKSGYNVATGAFGDTRAYGALPPQHPANARPGVFSGPDPDTVWTEDLTTNTLDGRTATSATSSASGVRGRRGATTRGVTGDPGSPVGPMPANASVDDKLERIHKQLDGMHAVGKPVLGRFEVLSAQHRRQGGQGIVQFARGVTDGLDYALKFFVSKSAFDAEGELYRDPVLGPLLPKIEGISGNEGGEAGDAHGTPLPPFIAMEKGEALDEWSRRAKPDLFQSVAMLANIAKKLAGMHEAGYVHRDLKPGNVMWLPRENRWTIIDFGCVAKAGEQCGIAYSLRYTAPEVIHALNSNERKMVPEPSLDAWSLGVMAFELLTGQAAFQVMVHGAQDIKQQLLGTKELPWEGERADPAVMRKLRTLRTPVMACLDRDPTKRPSMQAVCDMCDDIFGTRTVKA
eukprot:jgi/Ulvmu1/12460/UM009_0112.1